MSSATLSNANLVLQGFYISLLDLYSLSHPQKILVLNDPIRNAHLFYSSTQRFQNSNTQTACTVSLLLNYHKLVSLEQYTFITPSLLWSRSTCIAQLGPLLRNSQSCQSHRCRPGQLCYLLLNRGLTCFGQQNLLVCGYRTEGFRFLLSARGIPQFLASWASQHRKPITWHLASSKPAGE